MIRLTNGQPIQLYRLDFMHNYTHPMSVELEATDDLDAIDKANDVLEEYERSGLAGIKLYWIGKLIVKL